VSAIGVDVGGTKLLAVRIAEDGSIVDERRVATPDDGRRMVTEIAATVEMLTAGEEVGACGVGIAGLVDHDTGVFVWGPHVPGVDVAVRDELQSQLGIPVEVDNDANTTALAEHRLGSGRGSEAMLLLTLGTGIGGAMMLGGSIYRGRAFAGEFGHSRLVAGTSECDCGRRGCWETEAAGPALERIARDSITSDPDGSLARSLGDQAVTGPAVTAAARAGDPQAIALVERVGNAFGRGLGSLLSILDPDRVVIGGGLGSIGEILLGPIRAGASRDRYAADHTELPPIVAAQLGARAGAVGAGLLALDAVGEHE
jgi:glucokinase